MGGVCSFLYFIFRRQILKYKYLDLKGAKNILALHFLTRPFSKI
jgi:hypothetical protein